MLFLTDGISERLESWNKRTQNPTHFLQCEVLNSSSCVTPRNHSPPALRSVEGAPGPTHHKFSNAEFRPDLVAPLFYSEILQLQLPGLFSVLSSYQS